MGPRYLSVPFAAWLLCCLCCATARLQGEAGVYGLARDRPHGRAAAHLLYAKHEAVLAAEAEREAVLAAEAKREAVLAAEAQAGEFRDHALGTQGKAVAEADKEQADMTKMQADMRAAFTQKLKEDPKLTLVQRLEFKGQQELAASEAAERTLRRRQQLYKKEQLNNKEVRPNGRATQKQVRAERSRFQADGKELKREIVQTSKLRHALAAEVSGGIKIAKDQREYAAEGKADAKRLKRGKPLAAELAGLEREINDPTVGNWRKVRGALRCALHTTARVDL